jgi:hypothetical protein
MNLCQNNIRKKTAGALIVSRNSFNIGMRKQGIDLDAGRALSGHEAVELMKTALLHIKIHIFGNRPAKSPCQMWMR